MAEQVQNQRQADQRSQQHSQAMTPRPTSREMASFGGFPTPFDLMRRFSQDVDRLFSSLVSGNTTSLSNGSSRSSMSAEPANRGSQGTSMATSDAAPGTAMGWVPTVEMSVKGDDLVVNLDLPGVKPSEVQVELDGNDLIVQGRSTSQREKREGAFWYTERVYGSFYRSIPLPSGIPLDNIQAQFKDGGLEIMIPGAATGLRSQHRSIPVQRSQREQSTQPIQGMQTDHGAQVAQSQGAQQSSNNSQTTPMHSTSRADSGANTAAQPAGRTGMPSTGEQPHTSQ